MQVSPNASLTLPIRLTRTEACWPCSQRSTVACSENCGTLQQHAHRLRTSRTHDRHLPACTNGPSLPTAKPPATAPTDPVSFTTSVLKKNMLGTSMPFRYACGDQQSSKAWYAVYGAANLQVVAGRGTCVCCRCTPLDRCHDRQL
jgi:hypothetical protein